MIVIVCICFSAVLSAQTQTLTVEGTAPNLYITHKVSPKESYYSLARQYNQTPKAIAAFNRSAMEKGLTIGQTIKIPLTKQNLNATGKTGEGETLVPLYHTVSKDETLFRIANNYKVALDDVKVWNNLTSDEIKEGLPLVVGHLKVANDQLARFNAGNNNVGDVANNAANAKPEVSNTPKEAAPEPKKETVAAADKPIEKKEEAPAVKTATPPQKTETAAPDKPVQQVNVQPANEQKPDLLAPQPETSNEGVFAGLYSAEAAQKSLASRTGDAAIFKSTSGWQDKKYYVLMNDVAPGTILRIASVDNKIIFAKVLGSLPQMKENKGLLLRLSNAAAAYLGMADSKFPVQVSFYQ
jgi:LysM repeat protein